jgi:hypothetical protein
MRNKWLWILGIVLVIVAVLSIAWPKPSEVPGECKIDSDCVPSSCCHPSACVAKENAPACGRIMCTQECVDGTLDCGQGSCACNAGKCGVK